MDLHATEFAAQALLRLRTDLKNEPVAIVDGPLHDACACSMNRAAAQRGVVCGLPRMDAEADTLALLPLHALDLSFEQEEKFELWGIRSFADLAAVPESELIARLGARAREWQVMAWRGKPRFPAHRSSLRAAEVYEFDTHVLEDSNRPASFHLDSFRTDAARKTHTASPERTALRRVRPPRTLEMMLADGKPGFFCLCAERDSAGLRQSIIPGPRTQSARDAPDPSKA